MPIFLVLDVFGGGSVLLNVSSIIAIAPVGDHFEVWMSYPEPMRVPVAGPMSEICTRIFDAMEDGAE